MPLNVVRRESQHIYSATPPTTETGRRAVDAVLRLLRTQEVEVERAREASGLTENEFRALRYLLQAQREGNPATPKELGVMLGISGATITHLIDHLEKLGDVERVAHEVDRRIKLLVPTRQGADKIRRSYGAFHQALVGVLDGVDADDAATVVRVVDLVADRFSDPGATAGA